MFALFLSLSGSDWSPCYADVGLSPTGTLQPSWLWRDSVSTCIDIDWDIGESPHPPVILCLGH